MMSTTDACTSFMQAYVLLGANSTAIGRTIQIGNVSCPSVVVNVGGTERTMTSFLHAAPNEMFPVTVCDVNLPDGFTSAVVCQQNLPLVPSNPQKYLLIGDTGMRLKIKNAGVNDTTCTNYATCASSFSESLFSGTFQGIGKSLDPDMNQWPYQTIAAKAKSENPDVVIHVGDYLYIESQCPSVCPNPVYSVYSEGTVCPCTGIGTNFGDNWQGWLTEFFTPSGDLLKHHPWIALRGNHETCVRSWEGYFRFMYPQPFPAVLSSAPLNPTTDCPNYTPSYSVEFKNEVHLVTDTSFVHSAFGGIDHYDQICPAQAPSGDLGGLSETDPSWEQKKAEDLTAYTADFKSAASMMNTKKNNFFLTHCPVYAVVCGNHSSAGNVEKGTPTYYSFEQILMSAVNASGLLSPKNPSTGIPALRMIMSGHMHWFQYVQFPESTLPAQIVFGNGGTKLIPRKLNDAVMTTLSIEGQPIKTASSRREYGYVVMTPMSSGAAYSLSVRDGTNKQTYSAQLTMSAPVPSSDDSATTAYAANFGVELTGISSADFDADAQNSFSTVVAANSGSICGSASASTCTSTDVSISSTTRRSVTVAFSLGVYSSDSASSAVTTLSAYMGSGNFATDLTASGASGLAGITGTSVTSATTSSSSDSSSGLSTGAIVGIVVGCVSLIVVVAVIIYCAVFKGSKQNDCETDKSNEDCSSNHKEANPIASVPEMGHVNPSKADDHVPDSL